MDVCTLILLLPSLQLSFLSPLPSSFLPFISTFHSNLQSYMLGSISPGGKHNGRQNVEYKSLDCVFRELPNHSENKIRALSHWHHPFSTPSPAFIVCRLFDKGHCDWCELIHLAVALVCISITFHDDEMFTSQAFRVMFLHTVRVKLNSQDWPLHHLPCFELFFPNLPRTFVED